ncbi:MAG: hypothetical protein PHI32_12415 [Dysgonamonadaceae bacterium]|nr:hypothetical protein [Dysgonamonadaceae bacterium]
MELEGYLFKNVLDFTNDKLTITYCEKDNGSYHKPSIYVKDIASIFGTDILEKNHHSFADNIIADFCNSDCINLPVKNSYTLTELATFKLCPRLYYHQQVDHNNGV